MQNASSSSSSTKRSRKRKNKKVKLVKTFLEGLSCQLPDSSLENFLKNKSSLSLVLESSFDALPTNGAIRKLIGSNFDACLDGLRGEVQSRFDVLVDKKRRDFNEEEKRVESLDQQTTSIAIFSSADYNQTLSRNDQKLLPLLSCTNYATPNILHRIRCDSSSEISNLRTMITTFRSAAFSGLISSDNLNAHIRVFLTALKKMSNVDNVILVTVLRDFLNVYNIVISMNRKSLKDQQNETAFGLGEIWGYYIELAVSYPVEYYQSILALQNNGESDLSSSDSDEDLKPTINRAKASSEAKKHIIANLSAFFIQYRSKGAYFFVGMMESIESNKLKGVKSDSKISESQNKKRFDMIANIILTGLSNSRILTKKEIPSSKIVVSGEKRLKVVMFEWAKKNIPNRNNRNETKLSIEMGSETYDKSRKERNLSSDDSNDNEEIHSDENNSGEKAKEEKSFFVLDSSPVNEIKGKKEECAVYRKNPTNKDDDLSDSSSSDSSESENGENDLNQKFEEADRAYIIDPNPVSEVNDDRKKDGNIYDKLADEENTISSDNLIDEAKNNESYGDKLSLEEIGKNENIETPKRMSVEAMPILEPIKELEPIPEDDTVSEIKNPDEAHEGGETPDEDEKSKRTRKSTRSKKPQEDSESGTQKIARTTTPRRPRSRSNSIALSHSGDDSSGISSTVRRSTRRRRSTIDNQDDESPQKTQNQTPAQKPKRQKRTLKKKQDIDSSVDGSITRLSTPLRRSRRIRSNSESSTSVY